ncbi:uncharacterized protein LOC131625833 isoform X5 [Vicia villosa]|uniref:uncharacterized protein LOC131625833 isoform X5 n=1 Tax=Vicia villosa TaxID=3911 RepID=UPI00273ABF5E|nr:uncharacterized protein LOC131625833 isoform X5 [Vicia villosa]
MRVAVVGGGISGLVSAYVLSKAGVNVVLYDKEDYLGGTGERIHANNNTHLYHLGFMLLNPVNYPNVMEFFESLGVDTKLSYLSNSFSLYNGQGYEWGTLNGLSSLFSHKTNVFNPYFWKIIREVNKFKQDVLSYLDILETNQDIEHNETLGHFIKSRGYSESFQKAYLIPLCSSIWPCSSSEGVMNFSSFSVLSFLSNHRLLELFSSPQSKIVGWNSQKFIKKAQEKLMSENCEIKISCEVHLVSSSDKGCVVLCKDGSKEMYDGCIMAVHVPNALRILGDEATSDECRILGAFQYVNSDIFLHSDRSLMPRNPIAWSAWNVVGISNNNVCVTYWINVLQNIEETSENFFVTVNPNHTPKNTLLKWSTVYPVPTVIASKALHELDHIQGKRKIWFTRPFQGYGYHGDGFKAGMDAAHDVLGGICTLQSNLKYMIPSWRESGARFFVTRFLSVFITTGSLMLLEEGGTIFTFDGSKKKCCLKCVLRIHNPQFYWKVMTNGDLGIASAYIDGDFSFVDTDKGLLDFISILIANRDFNASNSRVKNRGWWTPVFFTAGLASAKFFIRHISRKNTVTQARRNISMHYDLSNELFACFLDEKMQYSCGVFKNEDENLKDAQMRKISILIEKARVDRKHEILDIGCGWGGFAIEVVKQTGCKYTGITLSKEQLKYAESKVKDAGLQDHITFLLCDYRQLSKTKKYDRIISCEMIEAVGHEYTEEFFSCCDSALAEDGLIVLQFTSIPDERYDAYRCSSEFIKEYIFPGCCIPCLSRVTSAMAAASRLCVEHAENIGIHYYQTLRWWRRNFMENHSKILALGFDEKFIRIWKYYFDYCAAGFKSRTLGNYQNHSKQKGIKME